MMRENDHCRREGKEQLKDSFQAQDSLNLISRRFLQTFCAREKRPGKQLTPSDTLSLWGFAQLREVPPGQGKGAALRPAE